MSTASGMAAQPNHRLDRVRITAAMVEDRVCPEGNEKSFGTAMSSGMSGSSQQGRGRATTFLRNALPTNAPAASPASRSSPCWRYFLVQSSPPAAASQIAPPFPSAVSLGIRKSSSGHAADRMPCKMVQSRSITLDTPLSACFSPFSFSAFQRKQQGRTQHKSRQASSFPGKIGERGTMMNCAPSLAHLKSENAQLRSNPR